MQSTAFHSLAQSRVMSRRKGLSNELGENNCFLNVIIQSLWHLRSCRVLITTGDHALHHKFGGKPSSTTTTRPHHGGVCLLCELEQIFILYQFAEEPVLIVDRVRVALGEMFQVGAMNDATETLEAILDALHWDTFHRMLTLRCGTHSTSHQDLSQSTMEDASAIVCEPQCIAHLLFQMDLMELKSCRQCGETNEPLMNTDFLYRVYAQELLQFAKGKSMEDVLQLEAQGGCVAPECVSKCDACKGGKMQLNKWILKLPMVFAVSVIWASAHVDKSDVKAWMELLTRQNARAKKESTDEQTLDLGKIFRVDQTAQGSSEYLFRGMVCYYGRHYVGFFKSRTVENGVSHERWFLFDDTRVKPVGTWEDVRSRVERGVYQPTLIFYERKGIEQDKLEKVAAEIHRWWKKTSEASDEAEKEMSNGNVKAPPSTPPKPQAMASPPPPSTVHSNSSLPMSPIKIPSSISQNGGRSWLEEDLSIMHRSAQDTLSRLNGILSRDVKPTAAQGVTDLRMSVAMPRSVRRREYSVRNLSDDVDDVNRELIFQDDVVDESMPSTLQAPIVNGAKKNEAELLSNTMQNLRVTDQKTSSDGMDVQLASQIFDVQLTASDGGLGLVLSEAEMGQKSFVVSAFELNGANEKLAAEASGAIQIGDELISINGEILDKQSLYEVLEKLFTAPNPVTLSFHRLLPWTCPRCTLLNDLGVQTCAACGNQVHVMRGALVKRNA